MHKDNEIIRNNSENEKTADSKCLNFKLPVQTEFTDDE